jgi:hypothetical protein
MVSGDKFRTGGAEEPNTEREQIHIFSVLSVTVHSVGKQCQNCHYSLKNFETCWENIYGYII